MIPPAMIACKLMLLALQRPVAGQAGSPVHAEGTSDILMVCPRNFADLSERLKELIDYSVVLSNPRRDVDSFSPRLLLDELTTTFGPMAQARGLTLTTYCDPRLEFERVTSGGEVQGTGLGLGIVKRLAELLAERIEVRSELGKGSCFELVLPLALSVTGHPTSEK